MGALEAEDDVHAPPCPPARRRVPRDGGGQPVGPRRHQDQGGIESPTCSCSPAHLFLTSHTLEWFTFTFPYSLQLTWGFKICTDDPWSFWTFPIVCERHTDTDSLNPVALPFFNYQYSRDPASCFGLMVSFLQTTRGLFLDHKGFADGQEVVHFPAISANTSGTRTIEGPAPLTCTPVEHVFKSVSIARTRAGRERGHGIGAGGRAAGQGGHRPYCPVRARVGLFGRR
jgi:hypothetical protein